MAQFHVLLNVRLHLPQDGLEDVKDTSVFAVRVDQGRDLAHERKEEIEIWKRKVKVIAL